MTNRMRILVDSSSEKIWQRLADVPEPGDIVLTRFDSIEQACRTLARQNVLLIFCESKLKDGSYEDLLTAAKKVRARARIVVTGLDPDQFDPLGYCHARALGAFDVLGKSFGRKDLEWIVLCAMRDEAQRVTRHRWAQPRPARVAPGAVGAIGDALFRDTFLLSTLSEFNLQHAYGHALKPGQRASVPAIRGLSTGSGFTDNQPEMSFRLDFRPSKN